ncbi:hypothetical protein Tco_1264367 [Tanacetum coccineum]
MLPTFPTNTNRKGGVLLMRLPDRTLNLAGRTLNLTDGSFNLADGSLLMFSDEGLCYELLMDHSDKRFLMQGFDDGFLMTVFLMQAPPIMGRLGKDTMRSLDIYDQESSPELISKKVSIFSMASGPGFCYYPMQYWTTTCLHSLE